MKTLFDTSVLVPPALVEAHPRHKQAFPYLDRAHVNEIKMVVSAHALAELYSTLTALPLTPRMATSQVQHAITNDVLDVAEIVPLSASDYTAVIERIAHLGLVSGAVYDGLHVRAAEKAEADQLLTFNGRDFRRMPPEEPTKLVVL